MASPPDPAVLAGLLAPWFTANARDLPWRRDRTGYRVWVSEVMLQQTRVATVVPFYGRFLARFPRLDDLANAPLEEVLALWSGLGYYRRARGLHEGAKDVVSRFAGDLPPTVTELLTIRGIGPYTAGAIASLAHGQRAAVVDGNVMRVFSRVFGLEEDLRLVNAQKVVWRLAEEAVPAAHPGAFNEALMELGATVCLPREPRCLACPLFEVCVARREGQTRVLPLLSKKKPAKEVHAAALLVRGPDGVLLGRRRGDALFGGLWEPPMVEAETAEAASLAMRLLAPGATERGRVRHVLTHRRMSVVVLGSEYVKSGIEYPDMYEEIRFVAEDDLPRYGVSSLARKIIDAAPPGAPKRARRSRPTENR